MNGFDSYRLRERADIARLVLIVAFVVLGGAFFRTQVIQHSKFQLKAETNRLRPIPLTPPRGSILDRHGRVIAENVPGYSVKLLAPSTDSLRAVIARVRRFVPVDSAQVTDIVERLPAGPLSAGAHLRRRFIRGHRQAGGAPVGPARTGDSGRAQAALPRGQIGRRTWPATSPR